MVVMTPFSLEPCDLGEEQTKKEPRYFNIGSRNDEYDAIYFAKTATQMTGLYVHLGGTEAFTQDWVI
jgi:hypothetical protein